MSKIPLGQYVMADTCEDVDRILDGLDADLAMAVDGDGTPLLIIRHPMLGLFPMPLSTECLQEMHDTIGLFLEGKFAFQKEE